MKNNDMRTPLTIWLTLLVSACGSSTSSTEHVTEVDPITVTPAEIGCVETMDDLAALGIEPEQPGSDAPVVGVPPDIEIPEDIAADVERLLRAEEVSELVFEAGMDDAQTVRFAAALANVEGAIVQVCDRGYDDEADFVTGCMLARSCHYVFITDEGTVDVQNRAELAEALAPVDSAAVALGMVSLIDRNVVVPVTPEGLARFEEIADFYGWQAYESDRKALEIEATEWGFVVRAPSYPICGCRHHMVRVAYGVTRGGQVCRLNEPIVPLAYSHIAVCVD